MRTKVLTAFADSLTGVFLYAAPVAAAFALSWLLHETPLRSTRNNDADLATAAVMDSTEPPPLSAIH